MVMGCLACQGEVVVPDSGAARPADGATDASFPPACAAHGAPCSTDVDCCAGACLANRTCGYGTFVPYDGAAIADAADESVSPSCGAAGSPCATGNDCCSGACTADHTCWQGARIHCALDSDCPSGMACQSCSNECVYPAGRSCDTRAPCPCGFACTNAVCVPNGGPGLASNCVTDHDCANGLFCNRVVFQCESPMWLYGPAGDACSTNADCPPDTLCAATAGAPTCQSYRNNACRTISDCPSGYECRQNQCEPRGC
jgi:hypothetical protein